MHLAQQQTLCLPLVCLQVLALARPPSLPPHCSRELGELLAVLLQPAPAERCSADELLQLPCLQARMHQLPAEVQAGVEGAAAAQLAWQQQEQGAGGGGGVQASAPVPISFHPLAVNACMPPAAYSGGGAGLLDALTPRQPQQQQQQRRGQAPAASGAGRGRPGSRPEEAPGSSSSRRERSASGGSERSSASTRSGLSCLDLAVPTTPPRPAGSPLPGSAHSGGSNRSSWSSGGDSGSRCGEPQPAGAAAAVAAGGLLARAVAGGSARPSPAAPYLSRRSCPDFLSTAASSSCVQI